MIEKIDFSIIRYANCWEDADVLLEALDVKENTRILSIASAGDNSFAFLIKKDVKVMAVDISQIQIDLCNFKKTAIQYLSREEYMQLLGFMPCINRNTLIQNVAQKCDEGVLLFIQNNMEILRQGIGFQGKFEKYFNTFRKYILPLIHNKKTVEALFEVKNKAEQDYFYEHKWNTWLWKRALKLFFSKWILGRMGRDPQMLKEVDINVGNYIRSKASEHLRHTACQHNYLLQMILLGKFVNSVPFYLREENYERIKTQIHNITFFKGEVGEAPLIENQNYHYLNLSNIFEYMNISTFDKMAKIIEKKIEKGALIAYWNLMIKRDLAQYATFEKVKFEPRKKDNGFFYINFILSKKK